MLISCLSRTDEEKLDMMGRWTNFELLGFATTSAANMELVGKYYKRTTIRVLQSFVERPEALLDAVDDAQAVLYGSIVLKVFDPRTPWDPSDINISCPLQSFDDFCNFLVGELHGEVVRYDRPGQILNTLDGYFMGACERKCIRTANATFRVLRRRPRSIEIGGRNV